MDVLRKASFEPSIPAAAALGPKTAIPLRRSASATPATSGASGPIDDEVDAEAAGEAEQRLGVLRPHRVAVARARAIPGLPGRGVQLGQRRGACASFHASACSRPPDPTRSTFTAAESTPRVSR